MDECEPPQKRRKIAQCLHELVLNQVEQTPDEIAIEYVFSTCNLNQGSSRFPHLDLNSSIFLPILHLFVLEASGFINISSSVFLQRKQNRLICAPFASVCLGDLGNYGSRVYLCSFRSSKYQPTFRTRYKFGPRFSRSFVLTHLLPDLKYVLVAESLVDRLATLAGFSNWQVWVLTASGVLTLLQHPTLSALGPSLLTSRTRFAYLMFTSGSTSTPKKVLVSHEVPRFCNHHSHSPSQRFLMSARSQPY